ncbi:MAG: amidohydrolase family protein [Oligoflexia bacterium]|nr:amidohydrolase family protein [Oligoflexia bacterium]
MKIKQLNNEKRGDELKNQRSQYKLVYGMVLNPHDDKKCDFYRDGAILLESVSAKGIYVVKDLGDVSYINKKYSKLLQPLCKCEDEVEVVDLKDHVILPSFFDMHFHWVQDDVRLKSKASLLEWLSKYAWPCENKFKDKKFSKRVAKKFFNKLPSYGTLGGAIYSSIHEHAIHNAMENAIGDFIIGNVLMTINSPDYLVQTKEQALKLVKKLAQKYGKKYAVTPRFAPSTDPITMKKSAAIAKKHGSFIQSHLSENLKEIDYVLSIYRGDYKEKGFKNVATYTDIYKKVAVLSPKTLMAHAIYLSNKECQLLAKTKTALIHCPTSNAPVSEMGLSSGLFDFKKMERKNIRWALGTDIGGGPFISMFDVMRSFVDQNRKKKRMSATYVKALYRATLAGAEILNISKTNGNLAKKKYANFIAVKSPKSLSKSGKQNAEIVLKKIIETISSRDQLENLVNYTFYKGNLFFKR